ncbi:trehalose-phosphatase [bacterium]|nr:trehalose-phosphatase [bacterium]NIM59876.1 trehalose-phosphatase [Candidatus Aminicenantes bacterium]NIN93131.1 trehalose-phosphatase [bacterium]NIO74091.1 trehalose-phosphatase [bacterium]
MQHVFNFWQNIERRLCSAKRILLLLDFDGTLIPIAKRPEEAKLPSEMEGILKFLARKKRFEVAIISGRSLSDLKQKIKIRNIIYVGNHGLEMERKGKKFIYPQASKSIPTMKELKKILKARLSSIKGTIVEDKIVGIAVHYRTVKNSDVPELKRRVRQIFRPFMEKKEIKIGHGKKMLEARPPIMWDKGKVASMLVDSFKRDKPLSFYLGDDKTDEDAFSALDGKGITVFVGKPGKSKANFFLKNVGEVGIFLKRLSAF